MSKGKLHKYLARPFQNPTGTQTITPIILSDIKGYSLRDQATNIVEQSIKWWCRAGRNSTQALDWLRQNIDEQIGHYDNIALYIWIGTCDLTTKNKQYISLTSCDNSSLANIKVNFEGIITILDSYPACTLTFLEIPVYSIYELNKSKGHKDVNQFKEQDEQLLGQIHSLNEYIRHLNSRTEKISPNFSQDLSHKKSNKSKNKHLLTRDNYNFQLYRDGVHPHPELARTWMRKLAVKIRDECWC
jgi:hypothetical protein